MIPLLVTLLLASFGCLSISYELQAISEKSKVNVNIAKIQNPHIKTDDSFKAQCGNNNLL